MTKQIVEALIEIDAYAMLKYDGSADPKWKVGKIVAWILKEQCHR